MNSLRPDLNNPQLQMILADYVVGRPTSLGWLRQEKISVLCYYDKEWIQK